MQSSRPAGWWNTRNSVIWAAAFASIVLLWLTVLATSPRSRLNVMQGVAVCFFAAVLFRLWKRPEEDSTAPAAPSSSPWLLTLPGMVLATAVWLSALNFYFINDDFTLLLVVRQPNLELIQSFFGIGDGKIFYRPLTYTTFTIDQLLWGATPAGFHLTNLLLHFASTVALFRIMKRLSGNRSAAWITAGIFAAMPIQVESVAWMAGRFDVLVTCLSLWTVAAYLDFRARGGAGRYALALLLSALAISSKETGFVLPILIAAIEFIVFRSLAVRRIAGFVAVGALMFAWRWIALEGFGGYRSGDGSTMTGLGWKTLEALFLRGPSLLLVGFNWMQPSVGLVLAIASLTAGLLMFLALGATITEERRRIIVLALVWIVVTMIPGHFLLSIGAGLSNSRILCLSSAGMALLLGQLVSATRGDFVRKVAYASLAILFSLGVLHNLGAWRWTSGIGEETLRQVIQMEPSPPANAQFVISEMPGAIRGVFFFGTGFGAGLQLLYDRDDVQAYRDYAASGEHPQIRLKWIGEPGNLIRKE